MVQQQIQNAPQKNKELPVYSTLLSFLSILELGKLGVVSVIQKDQDIQIQTHRKIDSRIFQWLGKDLSFKDSKGLVS